jgi:AcrR family transcriptional regulator
MAPARRSGGEDSGSRTALLNAAEQLMLEEGYAAVTSRRTAAKANLNPALVYYYFGTMDEMFIQVFRRRAEWMLERQGEVLGGPKPLWRLWDLINDQANTALNLEFLALGNHRNAVRAEVGIYQRKYRQQQLDAVSRIMGEYGVDPVEWPPIAVVVLMSGISRFLLIEKSYDLSFGHAETIAIVERFLRGVEGKRPSKSNRTVVAGSLCVGLP